VSSYREFLDYRLRDAGMTFEDLRRLGYLTSAEIVERRYKKGMLKGAPGFRTSTGKCELYLTLLERYGYDPLPGYVELFESSYSAPELTKKYLLILIMGARHIASYQSVGHNIPYLRELLPYPLLEIRSGTVAKYGIDERG
jgi:anaerobic selenocysteine-containing dehydrogenase